MSKRFGRNQKRAARVALDHERCLRGIAEKRAADLEAATGEIRGKWANILQLIKSTVDPTALLSAIAFDVKEEVTSLGKGVPLEVLTQPEQVLDRFARAPVLEQMSRIRLHPLIMVIGRDDFRNQKIVKLRYKDGSSGYAVSDQVMGCVPPQWLAERIARDLVHLLLQRDGDPK